MEAVLHGGGSPPAQISEGSAKGSRAWHPADMTDLTAALCHFLNEVQRADFWTLTPAFVTLLEILPKYSQNVTCAEGESLCERLSLAVFRLRRNLMLEDSK